MEFYRTVGMVLPKEMNGLPDVAPCEAGAKSGAGNGIRTHDLLITNQLLYQLSYASHQSIIDFNC